MINYSVYMRKNNLTPSEPEKAYACSQISEIWSLEQFCQHIADHNGVFSRGTVKGVITDMCECLVEQLLEGKKILLGELGSFGTSISSEGAESLEKFTANNIKAVNIVFQPGDDFENLIGRAKFNLVASRAAQTATLKAEKSGATIVDLAAAKAGTSAADDDSEDTSSSQPSGTDSQSSGSDSQQSGSQTSGSDTEDSGGDGFQG